MKPCSDLTWNFDIHVLLIKYNMIGMKQQTIVSQFMGNVLPNQNKLDFLFFLSNHLKRISSNKRYFLFSQTNKPVTSLNTSSLRTKTEPLVCDIYLQRFVKRNRWTKKPNLEDTGFGLMVSFSDGLAFISGYLMASSSAMAATNNHGAKYFVCGDELQPS